MGGERPRRPRLDQVDLALGLVVEVAVEPVGAPAHDGVDDQHRQQQGGDDEADQPVVPEQHGDAADQPQRPP